MAKIHASAVVDPAAEIADDVTIGPGCIVTGPVKLSAGVSLLANVYLQGPLTVGERTRFWPGACIGSDPQDYKVKPGFPTAGVVIGTDCLIREGVTVHAATKVVGEGGGGPTRIGDRVFMMVNSHAGHDAQVGNDVILVNGAVLAGHTQVFDKVTISGNAGIHQFCRIGRFAFISGMSAISTEVPPFCVAHSRNTLAGMNFVGMRRNGIAREDITLARRAYREVFRKNLARPLMIERLAALATEGPGGAAAPCAPVLEMLDFVKTAKRPICPYRPPISRRESDDDHD
ncbi:MAG: acyl-ACP--UDP-N-acetylglucosamine O-acyltransferase [Phycisphaerales bacterium]|nr:acyl-ACP--UDP-N-acetylglucosamine O-acyltransferase [Phycisphaerales bacterium]